MNAAPYFIRKPDSGAEIGLTPQTRKLLEGRAERFELLEDCFRPDEVTAAIRLKHLRELSTEKMKREQAQIAKQAQIDRRIQRRIEKAQRQKFMASAGGTT